LTRVFIGHLHPVIVHLPIGILLLACFFYWMARKEKYGMLQSAARISLLIGMISAIIACITGYLLSISEDYDEQMLDRHKWFGITLAATSVLFFFFYKRTNHTKINTGTCFLLVGLILITGHLGGSITHGADYLTKSFIESSDDSVLKRRPIVDVQEAPAYKDVIQPILRSRCYHCHDKRRRKGGLRMDDTTLLMKGGKDGEVILVHDPENSDLLRRILLPREEDDHMPPKERPQLKEDEIALIHWWMSSGASFDKKIKELPQSEKIKPILLALQSSGEQQMAAPDIPEETVERADDASILKLKDAGVVILPVAQNTNYLIANFVTAPQNADELVKLLLPLKKQLVWLKLGSSSITDSGLAVIGNLTTLRRLQIDHTAITDNGLSNLKGLHELRHLNLVGTKVTGKGIIQLKDLKKLESLYLYQTAVNDAERKLITQNFPKTKIDYGGYTVPSFASDTVVVKKPGSQ